MSGALIVFFVTCLAFMLVHHVFVSILKKRHAATYREVGAEADSNFDPRFWKFSRFRWSLAFVRLGDRALTLTGILLLGLEVIGGGSAIYIWFWQK
jgi:hypothetical protein